MPPLHHSTRGSGEPLLLIQGLSGHSAHWSEPFLSRLDGLQAILVDNAGTGASARWETDQITIADMADDAVAVLDELGLERAHVLGISMGGMIAQEVVLRHPHRVGALVLGCTYPGGEGSVLLSQEAMQELAEAALSGDTERRERVFWSYNVSMAGQQDGALFEAFMPLARENPVPIDVLMAHVQAVMGHDTSERLAAITTPTLVIHGDEDRMLDVANGRLIAAAVPEARLVELAGVGHLFWVERPEDSAALVRDHVAAHTLAAMT